MKLEINQGYGIFMYLVFQFCVLEISLTDNNNNKVHRSF